MEDPIAPWEYRAHLEHDEGPLTARSSKDAGSIDLEEPSPIIGVALHHSQRVRKHLEDRMAISAKDRRYEEDPETHRFLRCTTHRLTPNQSRYEMDMNRPPHTAVYMSPEMAWGNKLWKAPPEPATIEQTLERWYEFHTLVDIAVQDAIERFGRAVVLDLHSYNYQRDGATDWRTDGKPVINLGTRHLELDEEGQELKDWFLDRLETTTVDGEECLVEENSVFYGGYLNRRLSRTYGADCITLSVEYKKVYMDENTGRVHNEILLDLLNQFDDVVQELGTRLEAPVRESPRTPRTIGS